MAEKIEITKDGYLNLINKILEQKSEERELALDRYRTADEQMETQDQFFLIGKNAVSFLSLASTCTDSMALLAKEIKSIVYKDASTPDVNLNLTGDFKSSVSDYLAEKELKKDKKEVKSEDLEEKEGE